ncbi:MAG: DUF763 domain-containing protein [Candidatus Schekmanbacteria bacterium]|nr:MAG: DUF763 domain-containing protein [Candidatus Schekmanbacteria bacterium]
MKTGNANLPLHGGKAPSWLFNRMVRLASAIVDIFLEDNDPAELLVKLSDPFWFQSLGCLLGFDWHSSGVTTTVCGALKEAVKGREKETGFFIAGGKGGASRKTPKEIETFADKIGIDASPLVYASKMSAKVDNTAIQDGYQLYHHCFFFTKKGEWAVVQQGMNEDSRFARRYHWFSKSMKSFIETPHTAICCDNRGETLDMTADESKGARNASTELSAQSLEFWAKEAKLISNLELPARHQILVKDINSKYFYKIMEQTYRESPTNFEELLSIKGVGPKTIRSLSLLSELLYGEKASYKDPARFSFAHGGKDGIPYPVDRETYDKTIDILNGWINRARIDLTEKKRASERLKRFLQN